MERHTVRQFLIAERMAADRGLDVDRELLLCATFLHDAGLYPGVATDDVYTADGKRLAERTLAPFRWKPERLARCMDAIEQHHSPRSRWDWGTEVELVRRADLVEVTAGLVNFGVSRGWLRGLFREIPRTGFYRFIAAALWMEGKQHPGNIPRIFTPPSEPTAPSS
jgi:hypothetical protein